MRTVHTPAEVRAASRAARARGGRVALVPTMGFLHEGHLSLMRRARQEADLVVTSIFVNPAQFGPAEDLSAYPKSLDRDLAGCASVGVDVVWLPDTGTLYPTGFSTWVTVEGVSESLCGAARPGHFRGVATIVTKLLSACEPDVAFFGEKDYQQLLVIRRLAADLDLPVEVVGLPTVREPDGVALSSRNSYLAPEERAAATCLVRGLRAAEAAWEAGERGARALEAMACAVVGAEPLATLEYAEVRDAGDLAEVADCSGPVVLALAARLGPARLIDNLVLGR